MLIKCMVEPNGMVSDLNVIRGIDSECDSTFRNYFSIVKEYKHFRPGKINRKKVPAGMERIVSAGLSTIGPATFSSQPTLS